MRGKVEGGREGEEEIPHRQCALRNAPRLCALFKVLISLLHQWRILLIDVAIGEHAQERHHQSAHEEHLIMKR